MCGPLAVVGIGVALSAAATMYSGMASAAAAKGEQKQYEIQRIENATATSQASRDRFKEFTDLEATNKLVEAASGFSAGSFEAIDTANRNTALQDAKRIEDTGKTQDGRMKFAAGQARLSAKASKTGAVIGSLATLASGAGSIAMRM